MSAPGWLSGLAHAALVLMALALALPALLLLVQILAARRPGGAVAAGGGRRPRVALLVPAHNESTGLLPTLAQARAQMQPGDRLLVVADNCQDDTASVARAAGADVTERSHAHLRGKGYALDHGVRVLAARPPEVVVVLDADCALAPGCIDLIARRSHDTGRPVQATYLMRAADAGLKMRVAEFAMRVKNLARPRGMHRLGLPCGLYGTGMAFPWAVIQGAPLASGHLAEDMQLGVRLAQAGTPPLFCEEARVFSIFAGSREGEKSQRTRWEHGHLSLLVSDGPRLLVDALRRRHWPLAMQVMDMLVPPLALLLASLLAGLLLFGALGALLGWWLPLLVCAGGLVCLLAAVELARRRFAADIVAGAELLRAPLYLLAKIPLYLQFVVKRQVEWVRTRRDGGA